MNTLGLEDGYTKVPNGLLEAIYSMDFNSSQIKVLLCLIRSTYGYNKTDCNFSNAYVATGTGISKRRIGEVIKSLEDGKEIIVTKKGTFNSPKKVRINTNYEEWQLVLPKWSNFGTKEECSTSERTLSLVTNTSTVDESVTSGRIGQQVTNTSTEEKRVMSTGDEYVTRSGDERVTQKKKDINKNINKNTMCKKESFALFESLWKLYPVKKGKGKVSTAAKSRLLKIGFEEMQRVINRYLAELEKDTWRKPQNGSTFFNSGYIDYLDEEWYKTHPPEQSIEPKEQKDVVSPVQEELPTHADEEDNIDWDNLSDDEWVEQMERLSAAGKI